MTQSSDAMGQRVAPANQALRLIFEYKGADISLASVQRVEMLVPPSDPLSGYDSNAGFWIELRDAGGVVYRRILHNPVQPHVESHDPDQGSRRHPVNDPTGVFTALVPDVEQARSLVLLSSPLGPGVHGPATELAKFDLGAALKGGS